MQEKVRRLGICTPGETRPTYAWYGDNMRAIEVDTPPGAHAEGCVALARKDECGRPMPRPCMPG